MQRIDVAVRTLIQDYGFSSVIAAICRYCHEKGMPRTFRKLNKVYEDIATPRVRKPRKVRSDAK